MTVPDGDAVSRLDEVLKRWEAAWHGPIPVSRTDLPDLATAKAALEELFASVEPYGIGTDSMSACMVYYHANKNARAALARLTPEEPE